MPNDTWVIHFYIIKKYIDLHKMVMVLHKKISPWLSMFAGFCCTVVDRSSRLASWDARLGPAIGLSQPPLGIIRHAPGRDHRPRRHLQYQPSSKPQNRYGGPSNLHIWPNIDIWQQHFFLFNFFFFFFF